MNYVPTIPALTSVGTWTAYPWIPSTPTTPHVWSRGRRSPSGVVTVEVEAGSADVVPRQPGSARPTFPCTFEVKPPAGYTMTADCARPWPSVWHTQHCAVRRFAMWPSNRSDLAAEALREAQMPYTDLRWRRGRLAYGPCNMSLPDLTASQAQQAAAQVAGWLNHTRQILSTPGMTGAVEDSEDGISFPRDGWTPWGPKERGKQAGSGIFFTTGWEQAPQSPAYLWLAASCNHERWWHAYDRATGNPITAEHYGDPSPHYQQGTGDPNNGWLPEFKGVAPLPDALILPYDAAHSIRGFRHLVALSEMSDSPMVARMLRSVAAQFRLQLSEIGQMGTWGRSLRKLWQAAKNAPHTGTWGQDTGRQMGWVAYVLAQSVKRAGAVENEKWCKMFVDFAETAAMPTGIVSRCANDAKYPNDVWFDPTHDLAHAFEVPIFWHGAVGCSIQGERPIQNAVRFAEALYLEAPLLPYYNGNGPPNYAWVAKRGGAPYAKITGGKGNTGDSSHSAAGCALACKLDPARRQAWIDAAKRIDGNMSDLRRVAGLVAQMQRASP